MGYLQLDIRERISAALSDLSALKKMEE